jgi:hypothetical protein
LCSFDRSLFKTQMRRGIRTSLLGRSFATATGFHHRPAAVCETMAPADVAAKYGERPPSASGGDAAARGTENDIAAGASSATVCGVASNVRTGLRYGQPCTEFSVAVASTGRSGNADRRGLVEKQVFLVAALGGAAVACRDVVDGCLVHVAGRASFRPMFNSTTLGYDYTHEIVVQPHAGAVAAVLHETVVPVGSLR